MRLSIQIYKETLLESQIFNEIEFQQNVIFQINTEIEYKKLHLLVTFKSTRIRNQTFKKSLAPLAKRDLWTDASLKHLILCL